MVDVDLLSKLVGINSVSGNEQNIAIFLEEILKKFDFDVTRQYVTEDRFNVLGSKGENPELMFYGHMDTVHPVESWESEPFKLEVNGDVARGLGSFDMKGGIVSILEVCGDAKNVKVAFGVDEEDYSMGACKLVNSGWINGVKFVVIPESGLGKGPSSLIIGRRGRVVIKITVYGKSYHGANPKNGVNPIEDATIIIQNLKKFEPYENSSSGKGSLTVLSLHTKDNFLSVPEIAEITVDRHYVPPETEESVLNQIQKLVSELNIKSKTTIEFPKRPTPFLRPYQTDKNNQFVKILSDIVRKKYNSINYDYGLSVADENLFAMKGLPVVTIGPKGGNEHTSNEWVSISSVNQLVEIFKELLKSFDVKHFVSAR